MDAFDADVLIYAVVPGHPLGRRVRRLFSDVSRQHVGIGSVVLLPEVLARPLRNGTTREVTDLVELLSRLDLRSADPVIAEAATSLAAAHRLRAADAFHLATAVIAGADRFITNNRRDFGPSITEIEVVYPDALDEP
jgi:predicted nucleic acid-binding protein